MKKKAGTAFGILLVIVGVLFLGTRFVTDRATDQFIKTGVTLSATVSAPPYKAGRGTQYIPYRFRNADIQCETEDAYPFLDGNSLKAGDEITVIALPNSCDSRTMARHTVLLQRQESLRWMDWAAYIMLLSGAGLIVFGRLRGKQVG